MLRLVSLIYTMAAPTLAGALILIPLTAPKMLADFGITTVQGIIGAALLGALIAVPASFVVASSIRKTVGGA